MRIRLLIMAALTAVAGLAGSQLATWDHPAQAEGSPPTSAVTPLLSPRRLPTTIADTRLDGPLVTELARLATELPGDSCLVVRRNGEQLIRHRGDAPFVPASVMKILTTVVALELIGPETRFRTRLVATAPIVDGIVDGDLWVVGGGDPLLVTDDYAAAHLRQPQIQTSITALADALVTAGVREIRGSVIGDESRYDTLRTVPTWPERYLRQNNAGPLSALAVDDGFAAIDRGVVRAGEPAAHTAGVLVALLAERGVTVGRGSSSGVAPPEAIEVAGVDALPLADIVAQALRESDNNTAELLLKEMGRQFGGAGTTAAGAAVVAGHLAKEAGPPAGLSVVDGSGLDPGNRATCDLLVGLLEHQPIEGPVISGLPVAGQTGTLRNRLRNTPADGRLHAKTGSLTGVASLTGVVESERGPLTFAFVMNGLGEDRTLASTLQDRLGLLLADPPPPPSIADLEPIAG